MTAIKYFFLGVLTTFFLFGCASSTKETQTPEVHAVRSGYAPVRGIQMYYEIHGAGEGTPLVLLNGGGSTIQVTYSRVLPFLARHRKVIALEEQGHGRTTDRNQPFRSETSAEDVSALLKYLNVQQADILGFSNGAGVAMQMALRHPDQVRKLVYISSMTKKSGAYPWLWEMMKAADFSGMPQPLKDEFLRVNPDKQKLRTMCEKDIERMRNFKDVPDKDVKAIHAPTLILIGDKDIVKSEHAVELSRLIPHARLGILPGAHGEFLGEMLAAKKDSRAPEYTAGFIEEFLREPSERSEEGP